MNEIQAIQAVRGIVVDGTTEQLVAMLLSGDQDEAIASIGAYLWRSESSIVWMAVARLEEIEAFARLELEARARMGVLGTRDKLLSIAQTRAAEGRVRLQREIGKLLASLPTDPGGVVADGGVEPVRRQARKQLGIRSGVATKLVKLAAIPEEKFEVYVGQVRAGKAKVPRDVKTIVDQIERSQWSTDECYTPREWCEATVEVFGRPIGCDGASNLAAQAGLVRAEVWFSLDVERPEIGERERNLMEPLGYTEADLELARSRWGGHDGLAHEWPDFWWCNPPFSGEAVGLFHARFRREAEQGKHGVVMINADPSNADQLELLLRCVAAWPKHRINYWMPTGSQLKGNRAAQVLFGIGVDEDRWARAMESLAVCTRPWVSGLAWAGSEGK
jgi:hypothetical protein